MDLDDELNDLLNTPSVIPTSAVAGTTYPVTSNAQSLEDELFDLLNTSSATVHEEKPVASSTTTSQSLAADSELMSWLEDTPYKTIPDTVVESHLNSVAPALYELTSPVAAPAAPASFSLADEEPSLDSDEITPAIPADVRPVTNYSTASEQLTTAALINNRLFEDSHVDEPSEVDNMEDHSILKTLQEQVASIVNSPYPDLGKLRQLIDDEEYVPSSLRVQVLMLLLTGSCQVDDEAQKFTASEADQRHFSHLVDDCGSLAKSSTLSNPTASAEQMRDIIVLYCQRRNADYRNVFARILLSIFGNKSTVSKGLASSCFYSLCSTFLPIISLQHTPLEHCLDKMHSWLRLLVVYHSPVLSQHLDRVVPGWEKPAKELSSSQLARFGSILNGSSNLDLLEKELGIDLGLEFDAELNHDQSEKVKSNRLIQSAPPKRVDGSGFIPSHWIISLFAGCMPAEESAKLLDWSVFNGERFAGLFFIASLLEIHSDFLVSASAVEISQWFEDIAANKANWFSRCNSSSLQAASSSSALTWHSFTRGWIHATGALMAATPSAVRDALNATETWAVNITARETKDIANQLREYYAHEQNLDEFLEHGHIEKSEDLFDEGSDGGDDDDDEANGEDGTPDLMDVQSEDTNKPVDEPTLLTSALGTLRVLGSKLQAKIDPETAALIADLNNASFVHDRKAPSTTMTLWSSPAEVIPCICSNQRRGHSAPRKGVNESFAYGVQSFSDIVGTCFFISKYSSESPFYFAIDCRTAEEKLLGQFPKAFALDPEVITDGDALTNLIEVLSPIASTTHVTIIGPGEKYCSWYVEECLPKKMNRNPKKDALEIRKRVAECDNRVNAIAMFLIKKSFRFVSILDGGFVEAVKFMNRPDSRFVLSNALVDVDQVLLNSLLGIAPSVPSSHQKSGWVEVAPLAIKSVGNFISSWSTGAQASHTESAPPVIAVAPAVAPAAAPTAPASAEPVSSRPALGGWGNKFMSSFETIKKNIGTAASTAAAAAATAATVAATTAAAHVEAARSHEPLHTEHQQSGSFVIDETEDDGLGPREIEDTSKISIVKTDVERAQALAIHKMAGLKKGDSITILRAELPGAVLFPCVKVKTVVVPTEEVVPVSAETLDADPLSQAPVPRTQGSTTREEIVSRYLVVSRERFMVLDAHGGGVGSVATVKSNHHLTELIKMTFKKKDPELVTLHLYATDDLTKTRSYRVAKYKDFVTTLQKHMERFK